MASRWLHVGFTLELSFPSSSFTLSSSCRLTRLSVPISWDMLPTRMAQDFVSLRCLARRIIRSVLIPLDLVLSIHAELSLDAFHLPANHRDLSTDDIEINQVRTLYGIFYIVCEMFNLTNELPDVFLKCH